MGESSGRSLKQQRRENRRTKERISKDRNNEELHAEAKVNITMLRNENIVGGMRDKEQ